MNGVTDKSDDAVALLSSKLNTVKAMVDILDKRMDPLHIGGQWALQSGEVNGWSQIGVIDQTNSLDYGNYATRSTLNPQNLGGFRWPFDVRVIGLDMTYRCNNDGTLEFSWMLYRQEKTFDSNIRTTTLIYDGPLEIPATPTNAAQTIIDTSLITDPIIPAGSYLSIATGTPSQTANRNAQVYNGCLHVERA